MNTFYIPVHFYEQEPEDDELVMLITPRDVSDDELHERLDNIAGRYLNGHNITPSITDAVDDVFDVLAKELGGVWSYCKMAARLTVGDPERTENERVMRPVSAMELAALLIKLNPGESLNFFETYDGDSGETEGLYGATLVKDFEAFAIYINYYGGGIPLVIEVSTYDADLKRITEVLTEYFNEMSNPCTHVYVDADLVDDGESDV